MHVYVGGGGSRGRRVGKGWSDKKRNLENIFFLIIIRKLLFLIFFGMRLVGGGGNKKKL